MTSEPGSKSASAQRVALQVQPELQAELRTALGQKGFLVLEGQDLLEVAKARSAPLIICEVGEQSEALANQLLLEARDTALVFIGPTGSDTAAIRFNVRELSVDVSVSEVVRVCQALSRPPRASDALGAPPLSQPSRPFDVLPRVSDSTNSKHSMPAPLLPRSVPPSSSPGPHSTRVPSVPPSLGTALAEDVHARAGSDISPELARLLSDAEERVARSLAPKPGMIELPVEGAAVELDAEVMAALDDPIGDYVSVDTSTPPESVHVAARAGEDRAPRAAFTTTTDSAMMGQPLDSTVGAPTEPPTPADAPISALPSNAHSLPIASHSGAPTFTEERTTWSEPPGAVPNTQRATSAPPHETRSTLGHAIPPQLVHPGGPELPTPLPPASRRNQSASSSSERESSPDQAASEPTTAPPPSRMSDERITARPLRGTSPLPPAPAIPRGRWLDEALDPRQGPREDHPRDTARGGLKPPREESRLPSSSRAPTSPPGPAPDAAFLSEIPPLRRADAVRILASAIRTRLSGALVFETEGIVRRVVLRDGDFVTAASGSRGESLLSYLVARGTLPASVESQLGHKIPNLGRHAGAALVAGGHVPQDQLWAILRAHAEHLIARVLLLDHGVAGYEQEVPARLRAEPAVFGGATGSEVFIELVRRAIEPDEALQRLGGRSAEVRRGEHFELLGECAFSAEERDTVEAMQHALVDDVLQNASDPTFACVLYALVELRVVACVPARAGAALRDLSALGDRSAPRDRSARHDRTAPPGHAALRDHHDAEALRRAVQTRRTLIDEGDYFAILGVSRNATGYDIRRAYLELRRQFEPSLVLTPGTLDLQKDLELIVDVVTEAYEILGDQIRRDRYRRAIDSTPV